MSPDFLIQNVSVIPMPGHRVLQGYDVCIEGSKITRISPSKRQKVLSGHKLIDGSGKFLMPGLFDMHVHLYSQSFFPLFLMNGVTAIREMGNTQESIFQLREGVNTGKVLGPRMFVCGPILEGNPPLWKGFRVIRSKKEAKNAVKELKQKGADFIKVYHTLKPEIYKIILSEAHLRGLKVTGHLPKSIDILEGLSLGQDGFEHMYDFVEHVVEISSIDAHLKTRPGWRKFTNVKINKQKLQKLSTILKKNRYVSFCPTLVVDEKMGELSNYKKLEKVKETKYLSKRYTEVIWNPEHPKSAENVRDLPSLYFKNIKTLYAQTRHILPSLTGNGNLLAGSDTPNPFVIPGFSLIEELELLVSSGLKPYQALEAATYNAAQWLNVQSELGTIEEGKTANLVLLRKSPLESISHIRSLEAVTLNGKYFSLKSLKARARQRGGL